MRTFAVETLAAVLAAFNLKNVDVVAHSMGAHWSLWMALDRPQLVRRLVLLGNPGHVLKGAPPPMVRRLLQSPLLPLLLRVLLPTRRAQSLRVLTWLGHHADTLAQLPPAFSESYFAFRQLPYFLAAAASLLQHVVPLEASDLQRVVQPTLLLLGTRDPLASVAAGQRMAAALPHGELALLAGAGHLPWLESPQECSRLLQAFLAQP